jgi:hypothetical protein
VRLLCWCGRVCSDGDITGYGYREIAEACGVYRRYKRLYESMAALVGSEPGAAAETAYESGAAGVNIEVTSDDALRAARRVSGIDVHALETAYNSDYGIPYSEQNSTFLYAKTDLAKNGKIRKNLTPI